MALRLQAELTASDDGFAATVKEAAAQMQGLHDAAVRAGEIIAKMAAQQQQAAQAMAASTGQAMELARSLQAVNDAAGRGNTADAVQQTQAQAAAYQQASAAANDHARAAGTASEAAGRGAKATTEQLAKMKNMALSAAVDLAGGSDPFSTLANLAIGAAGEMGGFSNLLKAVPPQVMAIAAPVAAVAAVVAIGYKAWSDYHESIAAVERANKMAAVSIGMTRSALEQQAAASANQAGISIKAAREQQAAYIATGKIGGSVMGGLINISRNYALATGQDAKAATDSLTRLFSDPAKGAQELTDSMGLLSDAALVSVQNFVAMGNETAAQGVILDALSQRVQGASSNLTMLGRAGAEAARIAGKGWDWLGEQISSLIVNDTTPDQDATKEMNAAAARMASAKAELARLQQSGLTPQNSRLAASLSREYTQSEQEFKKHQATLTQIQQQAQAKRDAQEAEDKGRVAGALARELDTYSANVKKLEEQQQKLEDGLKNGTGLANRNQVAEQLDRVKGALGTMMTEQQKATKLQNAEAAAINMTGLARDQYLARMRAEVETASQLISPTERQLKIQQAVTAVLIQHATAMANLKREQDLSVDAANRLADAAGQGEAAQRAATYANEEAAASARSAQEASIIAAANKQKEAATVRGLANADIATLEQQTQANNALAAAMLGGADATRQMARDEYQRIAIAKLGKEATEDLARVMKAYDENIASQDRLDALKQQQAQAEALNAQIKKEAEEAKAAADKMAGDLTDAIYDRLTGKGGSILGWFKKLFKNIAAEAIKTNIILPIATSIVGATPSLFGLKQASSGNNASQATGTTKASANDNSLSLLSSLLSASQSDKTTTAALPASTSALLGQSLNAGAFALGNPFSAATQQAASGGFSVNLGGTSVAGTQSSLEKLLETANGGGLAEMVKGMDKLTGKVGNLLSGDFSDLTDLFSGDGLSSGAAKLRTAMFGGEGTSGLFGSGGTLFGSSTAAIGVSGALSGIGTGMMAGSVMGMLGIGKGNSTGSAIGGALGGAIGSIVPGVGTLLGSIAGGALGSLFGNSKPSNKEGSAIIDLSSGGVQIGGFTGKKYSQENRDTAASIADQVLTIKSTLEKQLGAQITGSIAVGAGSRDGLFATSLNSSTRTSFASSEDGMKQLLSYVTEQFVGGIQDQLAPEISAALGRVDFSDLEAAGTDIDFITGFRDSLKALGGDMGLANEAATQAAAQVQEQVTAIRDFHDTAARLFPDAMAEVDGTLRSYVDGLIGVREAAPAMTEVESALSVLEAQWKAYIPLMTEVGYTTAEAQQLMTDGLAKAKESAKVDWVAGMDREFNSLIGNDYINKIRDLQTTRDTQYRNADALGADRSIVDRNVSASLSSILSGDLRADQLQEAIRLFGSDFPEAAAAAQTALDKLTGAVEDTGTAAAKATATKEAMDSLADRMAKANGTADTLGGAMDSFDRAAAKELDSVRDRIAAGEVGAEVLTQTEKVLGAERVALAQSYADKAAAITAGLQDREFALSNAGSTGETTNALKRKQQAEYDAAVAAGYTAEQLDLLSTVLAGELAQSIKTVNDGIDDRLFNASTDTNTQDGALAAFDRQAAKDRAEALKTSGADMVSLEKAIGLEREKIIQQFADKAKAINAGLADREFALSNTGSTGETTNALIRKQQAEYDAAVAAGYSTDQLIRLSNVLSGELAQSIKTVNDSIDDRLFNASTNTDTLAGALEAFDRQADKDRAEALKTSGADMVSLEKAIGLEREKIIQQFADQAKTINDGLADRLFNATTDTSTLEGSLAAFDRQAAKERVETAKTEGADLLALETTLAAERAAIIKKFADEANEALIQAGGTLRQWVDSVRAGNSTPEVNRDTARSQFEQQLALAKGGNVEAMQGLSTYAQRLIDAETPYTASGADRRAMVEGILSQIEALPAVKSYDQQILEELQGLKDGINVGVDLTVIRTITEALDALTDDERNQLIQAEDIIRKIEEKLGRTLSDDELDELVEGGQIASWVEQTLKRPLTDAERTALLKAGSVEQQIEQTLGRQLTAAEAALLIAGGLVPRTVEQTIKDAIGAGLVIPEDVLRRIEQSIEDAAGAQLLNNETVVRTIEQNLTLNGKLLESQTLSQDIAVKIGEVAWTGQAIANRYLAAIAWNTARMIGAEGGGMQIAADTKTGDPFIYIAAAAAKLNIGTAANSNVSSYDGTNVVKAIANLQVWQDQVWWVQYQHLVAFNGHLDKIRHNTAETARRLGGAASYDIGTDNHPGGWAFVHQDELVQLPGGSKVFTKDETLELARLSARQPGTLGATVQVANGDSPRLAASIDRQARAVERQNALLEKIAANTADSADAAAQTASVVSKPARVKVGAIAKLRRAG